MLVIAPWVGYASVRSHSLVPVVETDATTLLVGTYLPGDGGTTGFKRRSRGRPGRASPSCGAAATSGCPGEAVMETVRARRPELGYRAALRAEALANVRRYALGRPTAFAAMMTRKTARMWGRPSQVRSRAAAVGHAVVVVLALAGLLCGALWGRRGDVALVTSVILASTLVHAVLVAQPRYALSLIALLAAGGASGLAAAWRRAYAGSSSPRSQHDVERERLVAHLVEEHDDHAVVLVALDRRPRPTRRGRRACPARTASSAASGAVTRPARQLSQCPHGHASNGSPK